MLYHSGQEKTVISAEKKQEEQPWVPCWSSSLVVLGCAQQGLLDTQAFSFIVDVTDEFPKGCEVLEVWTRLSATLTSC